MSVGTPVLASNVGAIHEFLKGIGLDIPLQKEKINHEKIDFNINNEEWIQKSKKAKVKINKKFNSIIINYI